MNSWWLRLYTFPILKKLTILFAVVTFVVCMGFVYFPSKALLFLGAYLLPYFVFFGLSIGGMLNNLEFHKMSVPLKDLRKAYFLDLLIQTVVYIVLVFLSLAIPLYLFHPKGMSAHPFFALIGTPSFTLLIVFSFFTVVFFIRSLRFKALTMTHQQTQQFDLKKHKSTLVILIVAFFAYALISETEGSNEKSFLDDFNYLFVSFAMFVVPMFGHMALFARSNFHLFKKEKFELRVLTSAGGMAFCFVFFLMCGFLFRFEINSSYFSTTSKMKAISLYSDFSPVIEVETARELVSVHSYLAEDVFKHADPAVYDLPVEDFIKTKDLGAYLSYLKWGKPSEQNIVFLMHQLEENPKSKDWYNPHVYREVKYRLVQRWPAAKALPDGLIKEKIETKKKRSIASQKKGP